MFLVSEIVKSFSKHAAAHLLLQSTLQCYSKLKDENLALEYIALYSFIDSIRFLSELFYNEMTFDEIWL